MLLLLFWEATSVLSFLLVGFEHDSHDSRESARQALLIKDKGKPSTQIVAADWARLDKRPNIRVAAALADA